MPTPIGHSLWSISAYIFFRNKFRDIKELKKDLAIILFCLFAGLLPDMDLLFFLFNRNPFSHRGFSHSIAFGLAAALICGKALKYKSKIRRPYLLSFLLIEGHIFWDFLTKCDRPPFGTMFFWPVNSKYYVSPWFIFPGFDWWTLKELLSIYLAKQIFVEIAVFLPILFLAILFKKDRGARI